METVVYVPHTRCKHSVRVTAVSDHKVGNRSAKMPDLYLTHDLLEILRVDPTKDFRVSVAFDADGK